MGKVITSIHPVGVHGAEILDLQLDKRSGELCGIAQLDSEVIYWSVEVYWKGRLPA